MNKLLSISLALLFLLSNAGIMYSTHYCYGRKVKSGFTQDKNAMNCLMAYAYRTSYVSKQYNSFQKKQACKNEYVFMQTDVAFHKTQQSVSLPSCLFFTAFVSAYHSPYFLLYNSEPSKAYNTPPPIVKPDYQAAHQVYRI